MDAMPPFTTVMLWAAAGFLLGAIYLWAVSRSVDAVVGDGTKKIAVVWLVARLALAGACFFAAAQAGAWPLIATLAGFLVARTIGVRVKRRGPDGS